MALLKLTDLSAFVTVRGRLLTDSVEMLFQDSGVSFNDRTIISTLTPFDQELLFARRENNVSVGSVVTLQDLLGFFGKNVSRSIQSFVIFSEEDPIIGGVDTVTSYHEKYRLQESMITALQSLVTLNRESLRELTENLSTSDTLDVYRVISRWVIDNADIIDDLIKEYAQAPILLRDDLEVSDTLSLTAKERAKRLLSIIDVNDVLQVVAAGIRQRFLYDSLGVIDLTNIQRERYRILLDSIVLMDLQKSDREAARSLLSSIAMSDDIVVQCWKLRQLTENVDIADELLRTLTRYVASTVIVVMGMELAKIDMNLELAPIVMGLRNV